MADRFISPCPPPEGPTRELLTILAEEAAEIVQRATKALRFGIEEKQPEQPWTNAIRLAHEIGDLNETVRRLIDLSVLEPIAIQVGERLKRKKLDRFLQSEDPTNDHH